MQRGLLRGVGSSRETRAAGQVENSARTSRVQAAAFGVQCVQASEYAADTFLGGRVPCGRERRVSDTGLA